MEFLVRIDTALPQNMPEATRSALARAERQRGRELITQGALVRIWRVPARLANIGVWSARDATELHSLIGSLPLYPWMDVRVEPLAVHSLESTEVAE